MAVFHPLYPRFSEVVRKAPRYRQGWRGLAETVSRSGQHAAVESLAAELIKDPDLRVEGLLIRSRTAVRLGQLAEARDALERATVEKADDLEVSRARRQFFFEHGTPAEAEQALEVLIARDPEDASAFHNLGTLMMRGQRYDEAVTAYDRSVSLRPNHAATHLNLGYALRDSGRIDEAVSAWEQTLRLAPNDATATPGVIAGRSANKLQISLRRGQVIPAN